jgi:hypothetical protein
MYAPADYEETPVSIRDGDPEAQARARKGWIVLCEAASLDFFARRGDVRNAAAYQLRAEPCPRHGERCLHLICGVMMQHVRWESVEPVQTALALLAIFLPEPRVAARQRTGKKQKGSTTALSTPSRDGGSEGGGGTWAPPSQGLARLRHTT